MRETSARLLRLLSLLQAQRDWTGAELADRLGVTTRTIRHDVERLRGLGYPVDARPGVAGGYRLGSGGALPPLLLDDEEAVAVAVGLRTAASGPIAGIEETSVRALAKLQQVLPSRLRHRVTAFQAYALPVPSRGPQVDPDVLTMIASACRDRERLRFDYRAHSGTASRRDVEPYRLVNNRQRWYLVAWDTDRDAWRTFRVDRIEPRTPAGPRFAPRALPPDREIAAQVARGAGEATWRYRARVIVHAPAAYVRDRLPIPVPVESLGEDRCTFEAGSDHPEMLALYLGLLDADFEITDSPELVDALRKLAGRYQRAIQASRQASGSSSLGAGSLRLMTIIPDTKDWTWVLRRPCPECGFDTQSFAVQAVPDMIVATAAAWREVLTGPGDLRRRPEPGKWAPVEYGCHVRDVFRLYDQRLELMLTVDDPPFPNWDQDATAVADRYQDQDPAEVAAALAEAGQAIAGRFASVTGGQWQRTGRRSDGASFTVETFARYFIHDPVHHLYDVTGQRS